MDDTELDTRLAALAASVPAGEAPPLPKGQRRRFAASLAVAAILVVGVTATASGAVEVVRQAVIGYEGVENPGQPLQGARMECMSPREAEAFLAARGFVEVVWQVESGGASGKGGSTVVQATAPEHGYVVPAAIDRDGVLHMVVDQRTGAEPSGVCGAMAMP
ncbi:MAG TPA: hypothetical protein VFS32_07690 [Candidatus Limnocylindrales bacterium]|nr:hypothetical protein [Candidatus Limnocylindrales bacterium]